MDVRDAVETRYSCRAFLPTPVPEAVVRDILGRALRAPSGGNVQPWRVHALAGRRLQALIDGLVPRFPAELPRGEGAEYDIYPPGLTEPYDGRRRLVGELLYQSIDVPRADKAGRYRQYARNFAFFGAPVGLFFCIDRQMGKPQWADLGMYMQTVMLIARGHGLSTCAQEAWTHWHRTLQPFLGLPPEWMVFAGMALGHADAAAAINRWRSPRAELSDIAVLEGFD